MEDFLPYMTNDGSVGLYNKSVNDIYHSAFGALDEAFEKFINPLKEISYLNITSNKFNVLDICYGIGYNSKAFLQEILNNNITTINIDCVDTNKNLIALSPFISSNICSIKKLIYKNLLVKNISEYSEAKKIISYKHKNSKYKIDEIVNVIILNNLIKDFGFEYITNNIKNLLLEKKNLIFFEEEVLNLYKFLSKNEIYLHQKNNLSTFVHNIYYKYITKRYNNPNFNKINMHFFADDIRNYLKNTDKVYDLVFLDGFTPSKCPCIWTLDIFSKLYGLLPDNAVIVTYNKSAPVRNAMINAGFFVGNTLDEKQNKIGTIASKNKLLILNPLSKKEIGLLNTKAGIPYRDNSLSLDNDTILLNREIETDSSDKISSSKYLKEFNYEI